MTTFATFATAVTGLTITGITRQYDYPPTQVTTADLPASFPRLPGGTLNIDTLASCDTSGNARTMQLIILVQAIGQDNSEPNYDDTITLLDAVDGALRTALDSASIMPMLEWTLSSGQVAVGGSAYWGITAEITGIE